MKLMNPEQPLLQVFETMESEVRSYCRSFPAVFVKAKGYRLWDTAQNEYIDFFAGAGALNYGHNHPAMKQKLIDYLQNDGVTHSLDMATEAKERFLRRFWSVILEPRKMEYKVMFPGPTGTNSVESALKLARKVTGRTTVIGFTNAFHGMTLGALAVTGNTFKRQGAGVPLHHAVSMPYDGYLGKDIDSLDYLESYLNDSGSGVSKPAAIITETIQGEGGINVAGVKWLQRLERICKDNGILLIVDDVQMGCGRTGTFFSFEQAGIRPDLVCMSKSIGGYGLPMALTLIRPELDIWQPGEHNGTFRGNNLAFVAAEEALRYWENDIFAKSIESKGMLVNRFLNELVRLHPELQGEVRGKGLMQGIAFAIPGMAERLCKAVFAKGLIMETSGTDSEVAKIMPPLTIDEDGLRAGLHIVKESMRELYENPERN
ncbi:diaminobutyrate--2-oxoglutarate transaminase [Paenibacillus ginsengarvi]|uniref:Diaminobutyrate--2-oxoglutarate transaminase n=1 Tax=Paenibacillus ginsengarvi TaxID=400777 RepID=A0A3B0ATD1_9BACL|nr:diaminobutyrate--2-oxoglutarate transaminase [Paenibacillus ginsengarvi]RKN64080.1 diaminobutyrate--2-oxoglutarate transaminase [Paenibacillus ginsengarvi]